MWEPNENEGDGRRRSVYIFQRRSLPLPVMAAFDAPVFSESCERRSQTTYWYEASRFGYAALLEVAPTGFVQIYPDLWEAAWS